MKLFLLILPLLFEAISEGLQLRGTTEMKVWAKQVEVLELSSWFLVIWMYGMDCLSWYGHAFYGKIGKKRFWKLPVIYILLRVIAFNYVHNIAAGLPLNYLGTVSFIDRIAGLLVLGSFQMLWIVQFICLVAIPEVIKPGFWRMVWGYIKQKL
jgi:hypothetical protein